MDFSSVKRMDMSLGKIKEQAALSANSYKEHHVGEKVRIWTFLCGRKICY